MKSISFVILNYNDADTTANLVSKMCLWKRDQFILQIVIVDNNSTDDSLIELQEQFKEIEFVTILQSGRNGGYSYGNNMGSQYAIKHFRPNYIAIANPDIWIDEDTLANLLLTFEEDNRICMCAPVMKDLNGNYQVHSQTLPKWSDDLKACFFDSKSKTVHTDHFQYLNNKCNMILTDMLPGSFFVVRADLFHEIGYLDEGVFLFCEERILGYKMKAHGYLAVLRSDLFFIHAHSVSIKKAYKILQTRRILLNSRCYYEKEYNHCGIIKGAVLRISCETSLIYLQLKMWLYSQLKR